MTDADFRQHIVDTARSYLGVRWRHRGRSRAEGLDCGGVPICVGREVAAFPFDWDYVDYKPAVLAGKWDGWPGTTETFDPAPGDLVMVSAPTDQLPNIPWHCGIVAEQGGERTIVHMNPGSGMRVVEELLTPLANGRTTRYFRLSQGGV